ncbi:MAG: hypothetical protein KAJ49_00315 [Arcobacteraceae bacterium]|nr:hypothetical protein [Arcobacteraceae bacterium]
MLRNYSIYKKLEQHIDDKVEEIQNETIWNILKAITPFAAVLFSKVFPNNLTTIIILSLIIFVISFKSIREKFFSIDIILKFKDNLRNIKGINIDKSDVDIIKQINSFEEKHINSIKELYFLYSLYPTKKDFKEFYIITIENDLKYHAKSLKKISNFKQHKYYQNIKEDFEAELKIFTNIIKKIEKDVHLIDPVLYSKIYNMKIIDT